jgi:hypothetical protein
MRYYYDKESSLPLCPFKVFDRDVCIGSATCVEECKHHIVWYEFDTQYCIVCTQITKLARQKKLERIVND